MRTNRRSPRRPAAFEAQLALGERRHAVTIVDISRHGARIRGGGSAAVGDHVVLEVPSGAEMHRVPGSVVWNDRARRRTCGIEFIVTCEEERRALDGVLGATNGEKPNKGGVLVMIDDPELSRAVEKAVREAGFSPITEATAAQVIKHLCRDPGAWLVAAVVGEDLPGTIRQETLAYLAEQWPAARRIAMKTRAEPETVAAALRGVSELG